VGNFRNKVVILVIFSFFVFLSVPRIPKWLEFSIFLECLPRIPRWLHVEALKGVSNQ
jgi:hypothetical protein